MKERFTTTVRRWGAYADPPWQWHSPIPFLERYFPFRMVYLKILERLLPAEVFLLFRATYKQKLWNLLCEDIGKGLGVNLQYRNATIPHGMGSTFRMVVVYAIHNGEEKEMSYGRSMISEDEALSKALGEFLERHMGRTKECAHVHKARMSELESFFTHAPLYLPWQKESVEPTFVIRSDVASVEILVSKTRSLLTGRSMVVPAHRIFFGNEILAGTHLSNHATSNGGGGGFTQEQAILSGWYELIERDGLMCHWLLGLSPQRIDAASVPFPQVQSLVATAKLFGVEVSFLDVTTTVGVPALCAVAVGQSADGRRWVSMGCAAGYTYERIFENSILEALTLARIFGAQLLDGPKVFDTTLISTKPFASKGLNKSMRALLWGEDFGEAALKTFLSGPTIDFLSFAPKRNTREFTNQKEELVFLKNLFRDIVARLGAGYHPSYYEPRSRTLSKIGYAVATVVVPSLFPLYLDEHMATLDIAPLTHWKETAANQGVHLKELRVVNTVPHPFL